MSDVARLVDEIAEIEKDQFKMWSFELTKKAVLDISVQVREGPSINAHLLDDRSFRHYQLGESFDVLMPFSSKNVKAFTDSAAVQSDKYVFVVENVHDEGTLSSLINTTTTSIHVKVRASRREVRK